MPPKVATLNRLFLVLIVLCLVAVVVLLVREATATALVTREEGEAQNLPSVQRSREAEAARWTAMAKYYATK